MAGGRALPGSEVVVFGDGASGRDGDDQRRGFVDLTLPDTIQKDATIVTLAARETDETFTGGVEDEFEESGQFAVYLYTDRPLYRPGQRIYYKGIIRRAIDPGVTYAVPEEGPVTVELRDPNGAEVLRESRQTNALGSISGSADLSPEAPTGTYTLIATVRGEAAHPGRGGGRLPQARVCRRRHAGQTPVRPRRDRRDDGLVRVLLRGARRWRQGAVQRVPLARLGIGVPGHLRVRPRGRPRARRRYGDTYGETVIEGETRLDANGKAVLRFKADAPDDPDASARIHPHRVGERHGRVGP